jgi:hypothetical protein
MFPPRRGGSPAVLRSPRVRPLALVLACAGLVLAASADARPTAAIAVARTVTSAARPATTATTAAQPPTAAATLSECVDAAGQTERYATFAAEMTALPSSVRMEIRIEVQERLPGEAGFHAISAPGLGSWRLSDPSVHGYRYLRQVTDLAAPAVYRASVHFRWLSAHGFVLRRAERLTPRCAEPALVGTGVGAGSVAGAVTPAK